MPSVKRIRTVLAQMAKRLIPGGMSRSVQKTHQPALPAGRPGRSTHSLRYHFAIDNL